MYYISFATDMIKTYIKFKSVHMHYIKKDKMGVAFFLSKRLARLLF